MQKWPRPGPGRTKQQRADARSGLRPTQRSAPAYMEIAPRPRPSIGRLVWGSTASAAGAPASAVFSRSVQRDRNTARSPEEALERATESARATREAGLVLLGFGLKCASMPPFPCERRSGFKALRQNALCFSNSGICAAKIFNPRFEDTNANTCRLQQGLC